MSKCVKCGSARLTEQMKAELSTCAENILLAREMHFPATMPDKLRAAHAHNDDVLERIYIGRKFKNDTERLEKLFELYTAMTDKLSSAKPTKAAKAKKAA